MSENNKNLKAKEQSIDEREREKAEILMKADEIHEETFDFGEDGQFQLKNEIEAMLSEEIDNPEAKYEMYYNVLNRLLREHLPKGEENKEARDLIYEEKNVFLTRGHRKDERGIRGADGRMSYISDIGEIINVVVEWVSTKGTPFDLFVRLQELNKSKGYDIKLV